MRKTNHYAGKMMALAIALHVACGQSAEQLKPAEAVPTADEVARRADELYQGRAELDRVREGVVILRGARTREERNYEILWRLARNCFYLGENAGGVAERDTAYEEGVSAARAATQVEPERVEGHYWLGANLAGRMSLQGIIGDLAAVSDVRRELEFVIERDAGFQSGGAYVLLARVESELPRVVGGDKKRAVEILEKGLKHGDANMLLRLHLAEAYLAAKRPADARAQLQAILNSSPHSDYLPEHEKAVAEAKRILREIQEKERTQVNAR